MLIVMQSFSLDWYPTLCLWLLNAESLTQLYLSFLKLLMIPETAIILNQISICIAYKRHAMQFWRNIFLLWVFCVLILYFIWTIFPNKYFQYPRVWEKYKNGAWPYRELIIEKGVQSFPKRWINNHVLLWLLLPGILLIFQIGSKQTCTFVFELE